MYSYSVSNKVIGVSPALHWKLQCFGHFMNGIINDLIAIMRKEKLLCVDLVVASVALRFQLLVESLDSLFIYSDRALTNNSSPGEG